MNKKNKNGVDTPKKTSPKKKLTKKDLELIISSLEDIISNISFASLQSNSKSAS